MATEKKDFKFPTTYTVLFVLLILVVTAYQSASGLLNTVNPTFAVVMGGLALARIGYHRWLKFTLPVLLVLLLLYAVILNIGTFFPGQIF